MDQVITYLSPKLIGGNGTASFASSREVNQMFALTEVTVEPVGEELRIVGRRQENVYRTHSEKGKITRIVPSGRTIALTCHASEALLTDYRVGDSMAINGVCLTAIKTGKQEFTVEIMPETYQRTTFSTAKINDEVNLERALVFNGRLEGTLGGRSCRYYDNAARKACVGECADSDICLSRRTEK